MSDDRSRPDADEQVLASLFRDLETAQGAAPDVESLVREHPHLEREIRELLDVWRALGTHPPATPPPPERLGEFRIVRRLETGGMGDVYEAWQEPLQRRVALKVLRRGQHSAQARERFLREQQVLARLHQTHIVPIHAAGRAGPFEYFAMPFIDGAALRYVVEAAAEFGSRSPGTRTPGIAELVGQARVSLGNRASGAPRASDREPHAAEPPRGAASAPRPSPQYLRSAAKVIADAALAVQHAHEQGVLHRDIKPSNIMVEAHEHADGRRTDQCWVIDFGLASYLGTRPEGGGGAGDPAHALVSGVMGTPAYMAPEQFEQRADERTDVWGLGVTLYELLTLRRAFAEPPAAGEADRVAALRVRIVNAEPPSARGRIPRDLEAICRKAMHKNPRRRYAAARDLADDLGRWLAGEVVHARCEQSPLLATPLRVQRWARRHRGWAAAIAVGVTAIAVVASLAIGRAEERRLAAERERQAEARERMAVERAGMIQQLELEGAQEHGPGWSDRALALAREIGKGGVDESLLGAYSTVLAGMDARLLGSCEGRASSVAFDVATGELLLGGAPPEFGLAPRKAGSWRPGAEPVESGLAAHGPVTCRSDDTRLQFVHAGGLDFLLRDITRGSVQPPLSIDCDDPSIQEPVRNELGLPVLALSADGAVVAAAVQRPDGPDHASDTGAVAVWDAGTGQLLCSLPVHATALALAGDGRRLATGDRHGRVGVWALPEGSLQAELPQGHELVQSLAFGPDPPRRAAGDGPWCDVRLAVGCASGRVAIWEVGEHRMAVTCRGMSHRVLALRFNGDGTILAAAGLNVMLWDSVTGDLQLTIPGTYGTALAFSADDRMLAVSDYASFERPGQVQLWSLEADRGIRTLRGLDTEVAIVAFSDDGRLLAGLSGDWFIAVWDCRTGAMRLALEAPRGFSSDNAGLAFSRDGRRLACLAGTEARLWDLASGERLCTWPLPAGLTDTLAFDDRGDLVAARCEPATFSGLPPSREQAVCRVRRLTLDGAVHVISEHPEFSTKVIGMALDPLGNWLAIEGKCATPARQEQRIKLVDVATGAELRPPVILSKDQDVSRFRVDPKGGLLAFDPANEAGRALMAMPSGEIVVPMSRAESLGPGAATHFEQFSGGGSAVFLRGEERPAIVLRDAQAALRITVDMAGTQAAWGTRDGTVMLADLARLLRSREDLGGTP